MGRLSSTITVRVQAEQLRDVRDTLIALQGMVEACRMNTEAPNALPLAPLLHVENTLRRDAHKISAWIREFESKSLPF